jgi:hypothetical protein
MPRRSEESRRITAPRAVEKVPDVTPGRQLRAVDANKVLGRMRHGAWSAHAVRSPRSEGPVFGPPLHRHDLAHRASHPDLRPLLDRAVGKLNSKKGDALLLRGRFDVVPVLAA